MPKTKWWRESAYSSYAKKRISCISVDETLENMNASEKKDALAFQKECIDLTGREVDVEFKMGKAEFKANILMMWEDGDTPEIGKVSLRAKSRKRVYKELAFAIEESFNHCYEWEMFMTEFCPQALKEFKQYRQDIKDHLNRFDKWTKQLGLSCRDHIDLYAELCWPD